MVRKDDPAFKKAVDDAIVGLYKSGEINKIYAKWFEPDPAKRPEPQLPDERQGQGTDRQPERQAGADVKI
jgi:glutamate/aspartate transport system substrate-binding protein